MTATVRRALGRFEVTCLGVNAIVGAGIFALPGELFRDLGGWSPVAFALCILGMWPVAWCYAEAAATTERSGGPYVYVREQFGELPGYVVGWMCFVNSIFSFAAVARVAAAYLAQLVPAIRALEGGVAVSVIVAFCALNALGAKPGARAAALFTIAKLAALIVLVVVALPVVQPARWLVPAPQGWHGLSAALFVALFAVQGFEVAPVPAGETREARRVMPFAILVSLAGAGLLYVIVQAVVVGAYPGLGATSETPLADAARAIAPRLGLVVVWGGIVSTLGFVAGDAFGTPRYAFAMAEDGHLPRFLTWVGRRRGAPIGAIAASGACAAVLALVFPARALVGISNLAVAAQYLGTCLAIGKRGAATPERRRRRLAWALLGGVVSLLVFTQGDRVERLTALAALGVGLVVATPLWWKRRQLAR